MLRKRNKCGPIGIDIGSCGVKLLQLADVDGQPALVAAAHYDLSNDAMESDQYLAAVRRAIEDALGTRPFVGREVVSALGSGEFQLKNLRLPNMPEEELAGAIEFEAQDRFDLGGRTAQIRHLRAGEVRHGNEIKEEVIVFAAPDEVVQARLAVLESMGLNSVAIEITPCAVARGFIRFLRRAEDAQAVNVFVEVGWRGTSIIITHGAHLAFLKIIDVGGRHFTEAVSRKLNLDQSPARLLRLRRMQQHAGRRRNDQPSVPQEIDLAVSDAVRPLIEQMSRDIQLCLRYYAVTFRGQRPDSITLVGGEASEPTLAQTLSDEIGIPCIIGHPLRGIGNLDALIDREQRTLQPAWAVACGLALRGSAWVQPHSASAGGVRQAAPAAA